MDFLKKLALLFGFNSQIEEKLVDINQLEKTQESEPTSEEKIVPKKKNTKRYRPKPQNKKVVEETVETPPTKPKKTYRRKPKPKKPLE
jgi:hypothetical protein